MDFNCNPLECSLKHCITVELCAHNPEAGSGVFAYVGSLVLGVIVQRPVVVFVHHLLLRVQPLGAGQGRHNYSHGEAETDMSFVGGSNRAEVIAFN